MQWKKPARENIGVDLDPDIVSLWNSHFYQQGLKAFECSILQFMTGGAFLISPDAFLYLDPPYPHSTRSMTNKYKYEMSDADHIAILRAARSLRCMVAISTYDNDLYRDLLHDWRRIHFSSQTRGGQRLETLYMNYPEPTPEQLHDTRFLGADFRAREKSKRRINTIIRKIERLTPEEKAILQHNFFKSYPLNGG